MCIKLHCVCSVICSMQKFIFDECNFNIAAFSGFPQASQARAVDWALILVSHFNPGRRLDRLAVFTLRFSHDRNFMTTVQIIAWVKVISFETELCFCFKTYLGLVGAFNNIYKCFNGYGQKIFQISFFGIIQLLGYQFKVTDEN